MPLACRDFPGMLSHLLASGLLLPELFEQAGRCENLMAVPVLYKYILGSWLNSYRLIAPMVYQNQPARDLA